MANNHGEKSKYFLYFIEFHDCLNEKLYAIFILDLLYKIFDTTNAIIIGGYCPQSWFSPYKKGFDSKGTNYGYYVADSADCKLFVIRSETLSEKLKDTEFKLPLSIKINNTDNEDLMVAANQDGPNIG